MRQFFQDLLAYNHHSNQKLWTIFNEHSDKTSEKSVTLFNHILNAQQIWNNRIEPKQPIFGVWDNHPITECKDIDSSNFEFSLYIVDKYGLNEIINYTNSKGNTFSKSIRDILFHAINHSTYHRGQIATEFKQNGLEPMATDYILYKK